MQIASKAFPSLLVFFALCANVFAQTAYQSDNFHDNLTAVLQAYVYHGQVNYAGIRQDRRFSDYLNRLAHASPEALATKAEKLAFWINAYNALAIKGILEGHSPASFWGRIIFFKTTKYRVAGRSMNLYDLEHDILIPLHEPRIHFAIVCASLSCPKLVSQAYLAATLEQQLDDNAMDFINDPAKNNFDDRKKEAHLSKIFDWFADDFKQHSGSVQKYIALFIRDPLFKQTLLQEAYRIKYRPYDWSLNGIPAN